MSPPQYGESLERGCKHGVDSLRCRSVLGGGARSQSRVRADKRSARAVVPARGEHTRGWCVRCVIGNPVDPPEVIRETTTEDYAFVELYISPAGSD